MLQLFVAYTLIEHQEQVIKNIMKKWKKMIIDTLVYYWMCTTIKNAELLKGCRTVISKKQFQKQRGFLNLMSY